jgi:putative ABC transport system permease protein
VFAHVKSAPETLRERLDLVPGVAFTETRLLTQVSALLPGYPEPISLQLLSLPDRGMTRLGAISLREGRLPDPNRGGEAVVLEAFARGQGLSVGDRLSVVMAGIRSDVRLVGIALAPEYVFSIAPGEMMPDPRRFGVLWMNRNVVAAAFDMQGAFNDVVVRLQPGASEPAVLRQLDQLLAPYGTLGAHGRDRQPSNNVLRAKVAQLEMLTRMMPTIFLGVAAFLINVVLSRLVQLQRTQVAALKAVGYSRRQVGLHYLELVCLIVILGSLLGVAVGWWSGAALTGLYTQYFHFPSFEYQLAPRVVGTAVAISLFAAVIGALTSVRQVMKLPPAEAMRPEQPASYRAGLAASVRRALGLGQAWAMVLRELERRPLRALLSSAGIAMCVAVLVAGRFGTDAVEWFMAVQFELAQRDDVSVTFREPQRRAALLELDRLPGVLASEGLRSTSVRYRAGHRSRMGVLLGHPEHADLRRVLDAQGHLAALPERGVLLSSTLGQALELRVGDPLEVQPLEGAHRTERLVVGGFVDDVLGLFGHLPARTLDRMLHEEGRISQALLRIDPLLYDALMRALRTRPAVLSVTRREAITDQFREQTEGQMRFTTLILSIFAMIIASGVVYNNARIVLSSRSRDLASLRVLGFRRREISTVLLGELSVHVVLALLPGIYAGRILCHLMMAVGDTEMYRFPVVVSAHTYAFAVVVTLVASLASALLVRRRLDRLDLIAVLKSRE